MAEMHGRIYAARTQQGVKWFFQDANGAALGSVQLDQVTIDRWTDTLAAFSE